MEISSGPALFTTIVQKQMTASAARSPWWKFHLPEKLCAPPGGSVALTTLRSNGQGDGGRRFLGALRPPLGKSCLRGCGLRRPSPRHSGQRGRDISRRLAASASKACASARASSNVISGYLARSLPSCGPRASPPLEYRAARNTVTALPSVAPMPRRAKSEFARRRMRWNRGLQAIWCHPAGVRCGL